MIVKLLTEQHLESLSLKGGCTGSSESTLVKMPHCWKLHVMPQIYLFCCLFGGDMKIVQFANSADKTSTHNKIY